MADAWDIREATWPDDPAAAAEALADGQELAWLDSTGDVVRHPGQAGFSLLCARPVAVLEQFDRRPAILRVGAGGPVDTGNTGSRRSPPSHGRAGPPHYWGGSARGTLDDSGWRLWRQAVSRLSTLPPTPWDLSPGWVGYIGFEMARQLERLPASHREDLGLPLLRMALFDRGIVLDHRQRRAFAVRAPGLAADDPDWLTRWEQAARARREPTGMRVQLRPEMELAAYQRMVVRALEYIAAGDIYQVNLAHRLRLDGIADPLGLYCSIRRANPAPWAALIRWEGGAVASVSPELFLRLRAGRVRTRPIKGTRPRTGDPVQDAAFRRELLASPKEAAELVMIVDLHRNDLGRVCRPGSVRVEHPRRVEAHPTVLHTVADVVGELAPGRDGLDLLAACFPAGSISGVPKIRALQIIDELEPVARGAYTGAIGVLGLDGQMTFNVAIRTLQIRGSAATLYVGGGIVADSQPAAEYEETLAKARGILGGLMAPSSESRVASCE